MRRGPQGLAQGPEFPKAEALAGSRSPKCQGRGISEQAKTESASLRVRVTEGFAVSLLHKHCIFNVLVLFWSNAGAAGLRLLSVPAVGAAAAPGAPPLPVPTPGGSVSPLHGRDGGHACALRGAPLCCMGAAFSAPLSCRSQGCFSCSRLSHGAHQRSGGFRMSLAAAQ